MYSFVQPECTFILLDPALPDTEGTGQHGGGETALSPNPAFKSCFSWYLSCLSCNAACHSLRLALPARSALSQAVRSNLLTTMRQQPAASLHAVCLYSLCYTGMVGDVNLFLNDAEEPTVAEIEVIRSQMHCKHMQLVLTHSESIIAAASSNQLCS